MNRQQIPLATPQPTQPNLAAAGGADLQNQYLRRWSETMSGFRFMSSEENKDSTLMMTGNFWNRLLFHLNKLTDGEVKLSLCFFFSTVHHAMKAYWRSRGIAPCILDFGIRWRWGVSFTSRSLYPQGKSTCYLLYRKLGGPQSRCRAGSEEKNFQPLLELEPPIIQLVAQSYTTELSRLLN
jgi:hypothetical protein